MVGGDSLSTETGRRLSRAEVVWLGMAILVPLAFDPSSRSPFVLSKLTVLSLGASLLIATVLGELRGPLYRFGELADARPRLTGFAAPVACVLMISLLATLVSVSPWTSFLGSYERAQGFSNLATCLTIFLLVAWCLPGVDGTVRLFRAISLTAILAFSVGLAQIAGLDSLLGLSGLVSDSPSPMLSTFGRSNFLAAYLAMTLPIAMSLTWIEANPSWRSFAAVAMFCQALGIAMSGARSASAAAIVGPALFWLLTRSGWRRLLLHQRWFWYSIAALSALLVSCGLWATQYGVSGAARLATWEATLRLIVKRPFLGYGHEGLGLVFPSVFPPELVYYQGRDVWVDRAHNVALDSVAAIGVLGATSIVVLLATALAPTVRSMATVPRSSRDIQKVAVLAALVAATVDSLTSLWVTSTILTGALLLGCLVNLSHPSDLVYDPVSGRSTRRSESRLRDTRIVVSSLLLVGLLFSSVVAVTSALRWAADRAVRAAEVAAAEGAWQRAREELERALDLWALEAAQLSAISRVERQIGLADGAPLAAFNNAVDHLSRAIELQPTEFRWRWEQSTALLGLALQTGDIGADDFALRAEEQLGKAVELAPNHAIVWAEWARLALARGSVETAVARFEKATDLDGTDHESWLSLAELELARSRLPEARTALEHAIQLRPADPRITGLEKRLQERIGSMNAP